MNTKPMKPVQTSGATQERINRIAAGYGATSGEIGSERCNGRYAGTVDYVLLFNDADRSKLYVANSAAWRHKSLVQRIKELAERYNPTAVAETKRIALHNLSEHQRRDDELAASLGLPKYEVRSVELLKGNCAIPGWWGVVLFVGGRTILHVTSGTKNDIEARRMPEYHADYFTAHSDRDPTDYVFLGLGHSFKDADFHQEHGNYTFQDAENVLDPPKHRYRLVVENGRLVEKDLLAEAVCAK